MEDKKTELPWQDLKHTQGGIPWPALFEFAAAVVSDESLASDLLGLYEQACESGFDRPHYEDLYVPAIFALAASRLDNERRREIGVLLIEKLVEAGWDDADLSMEVLTATCGSMGPVILPAVLDAIEDEPDRKGAWFYLWGLTGLAAHTEDAEVRDSVIKACTDLLQQADRGDIDQMDAIEAAWTLAQMKCSDSVGLLERLKTKAVNALGYGDYAEALDLLRGHSDEPLSAKSWEVPVSEWLGNNWRVTRDWYVGQGHECGEDETETASRRPQELAGRFMESSEAAKLGADLLEDAEFITANVLKYAWDYVGAGPEEFNEYVLSEVLLELLPRKIPSENKLFEKVAPVTGAFLKWLETEGILTDTANLAEAVLGWADTIVANSTDPKRWGTAKSLVMQAKAEGVDIADEEAVQAFIADYYRRLFDENLFDEDLSGEDFSDDADFTGFAPTMPIVEQSPKIGRNEPCPCGSGKKYKKCCGGVKKAGVHT